MSSAIIQLYSKMNLLKEGIARWEGLLKTKQKEIHSLKVKNAKRKPAKEKKGE